MPDGRLGTGRAVHLLFRLNAKELWQFFHAVGKH
jgi:hypothetical protein